MFKWEDGSRPIQQLCKRTGMWKRKVCVQVPSQSLKRASESFKKVDISQVFDRLLENSGSNDPWNVLDFGSELHSLIIPVCLTGANAQLLLLIKNAIMSSKEVTRPTAEGKEWSEWTQVLEWVLLSEAGNNTGAHMDSHGLSTWITVQEGEIGFGWLSQPTKGQLHTWAQRVDDFPDAKWRYVVLRPGQTIIFPSGTVHFVFRRPGPGRATFALGGHFLQWSGILRWIEILQLQLRYPDTTNESLEKASRYIGAVKRLLAEEHMRSQVKDWGVDLKALSARLKASSLASDQSCSDELTRHRNLSSNCLANFPRKRY